MAIIRIFFVFTVGVLLAVDVAQPQDSPTGAALTAPVEIHGSIRSRLEMWDWFGRTDAGSYAYSGNVVRLSFGQSGKRVNWKAELAAPILLGLPDNAILPGAQGQLGLGATYYASNKRNTNAAMVFPKQVYLEFHGLGDSERHNVKLGRFEFIDGAESTPKNATLAALKRTRINQRLIGSFGWSHVGRSFDGLVYSYNAPSGNFTAMASTPTRGVFQVDGWGWNQTAVAYGAFTRNLGGGSQTSELRLFGIYYDDFRDVVKTDNRPIADRRTDLGSVRIFSYGGHFLHATETPAGTVDLTVWGLLQNGSWGSLDHRGGAINFEAGFQPKGIPALKPWLRAGYFRSTGDDNPNDGEHSTFFQILPTPRPFARFPFYDLVNNEDFFGTLTLRPHARVTVTSEVHALRLSSRDDLWFLGGGVFQPWTFGYVGRPGFGARGLATQFDAGVAVKASKNLTLEGYYGYANGKGVMRAIYPDDKNGAFGYLEASYTF